MSRSSLFPFSRFSWLVAVLPLALAGCGGHAKSAAPTAAAPASKAVVVEAADAVTRTVPVTTNSVGHLDAILTASVVPLVNARIEKVLVTDGEEVKAGQPLIQFDNRTYAAQLQRMQGEKSARAAQVAALQSRQDRSAGLIANDFLSSQQVQEQAVELAQAKAALAAADAGVAQATLDLENCEPKASFAGRVGLIKSSATEGSFASAGSDPLLEVRSLDQLKVEFTVPESVLPILQEMAAQGRKPTVEVSASDDPAGVLKGPVTAFDNVIDPKTRSLRVRAVVANPGRKFWPGQFVDVRMVIGNEENAILVPVRAINTGPSGPYLYTVENGKAMIKTVKLGPQIDELVVVRAGLSSGAKVILGGQLGLQDGSSVQVSTATQAAL